MARINSDVIFCDNDVYGGFYPGVSEEKMIIFWKAMLCLIGLRGAAVCVFSCSSMEV